MKLPLYAHNDAPRQRPEDAHTGLWYDKFCNLHPDNFSGLKTEKNAWIQTVCGLCGDKKLIDEATERMAKLIEAHGQEPLFYVTTSRFVTGLGREHPVENGFAWHPTLGVAYWPGSSVKGLVRAWAEQWAEPKPSQEDVRRIFGPTTEDLKQDKSLTAHIGSVIFLDTLPNGPVTLEKDVMTPHYQPYYQDDNEPPADWHSPNPVPFLVVGAGQKFVFGLLPRKKASAEDCERAATWLTDALTWLGAGAKTAVGYGRFEVDEEAARELEERRRKAKDEARRKAEEAAREAKMSSLPPILRAMYKDGYENSDTFRGEPMNKWLKLMEQAMEQGETTKGQEIAGYLKDWYEHKFSGKMNKRNREKLDRVKKVLP